MTSVESIVFFPEQAAGHYGVIRMIIQIGPVVDTNQTRA